MHTSKLTALSAVELVLTWRVLQASWVVGAVEIRALCLCGSGTVGLHMQATSTDIAVGPAIQPHCKQQSGAAASGPTRDVKGSPWVTGQDIQAARGPGASVAPPWGPSWGWRLWGTGTQSKLDSLRVGTPTGKGSTKKKAANVRSMQVGWLQERRSS
jgi:hypothetical protein